MTEQLKTLNDFDDFGKGVWSDAQRAMINDLRQEAVKWIRAMKGQSEFCLKCGKSHEYGECKTDFNHRYITNIPYETTDINGAIQYIQHFFNITDKDLEE